MGTPAPISRPRRKRRWTKWVGAFLIILLLWIAAIAWAGKTVWDKVTKVDAIPTSGERPGEGKGTNIVLVGSDSREGLSAAQKHDLGTGSAAGRRTDSIMLLHMPDSGSPTLVSLPRDSYVKIPGHRKNKINASFSVGGPQLLVQTVEGATNLHVDGYMEIGFGGFASVVDSVGGVRMCLPKAMKDEKAHINLPAGCQNLDGKNALGYVRARYSDPLGDLGRAKRQREFLGALMKKMASPSNIINPFKLKKMGASGAQGVAVDKDMSPWEAFKVMRALKSLSGGKGQSIQVPVADTNYSTPAGSAVLWDDKGAAALFDALNQDQSPNVKP
ncbi:transcriptional regulator [Luteipulveratus mongoliensis]|uniref:Transcriptional regulator n=2 Tax=Luteipulveratus mongoliensis TaxID=571913 RepID=A0A0K1JHL0_9MICO|nr:transcriptional regulator [Luteipulveratus mongoliensis]